MSAEIIDSDILDSIYLGCVDTKHWYQMLDGIARSLNATEMIFCPDAGLPGPERVFSASHDETSSEAEYSAILDKAAHHQHTGGQPPSCRILDGEASAPGFWMVLQDARARTAATFLLRRREGPFEQNEAVTLEPVVPHLFRAALLMTRIEQSLSQARTALALLDLLQTPVFLVDAQLSVVLSNAAARKLERTGAVKLHRKRLSFRSQESMKRAQQAILNSGRDDSVFEQERLIRIEQADGTLLLAVVEPLDGLFPERGTAPEDAVAAIFLKDPERPVRSVEAVMREMHNMPPAEARLAAALADGKTLKQYAIDADLSEGYVRDLSKRVMHRLGVKRQQQLIRSIIQMSPEING